ncbi:MAG: hypothetical protein IMX01_08490 [Limnochordaceae bacterium]|nr:hypothetical protein [Limnochordaceae bacterium]
MPVKQFLKGGFAGPIRGGVLIVGLSISVAVRRSTFQAYSQGGDPRIHAGAPGVVAGRFDHGVSLQVAKDALMPDWGAAADRTTFSRILARRRFRWDELSATWLMPPGRRSAIFGTATPTVQQVFAEAERILTLFCTTGTVDPNTATMEEVLAEMAQEGTASIIEST